jgi:hypothetical protein
LTLDDDVETGSRIEIPEQSSGSELFFFSFEQQQQNSDENEAK